MYKQSLTIALMSLTLKPGARAAGDAVGEHLAVINPSPITG